MGKGLFDIVLDAKVLEPIYNQNLKLISPLTSDNFEWVLLYKAIEYPICVETQLNCNLEIVGSKFNVKRERKIERRIQVEKANLLIQREVRVFLSKVRAEKAREKKNSMLVQGFIRRKFAYMAY